MAEEVQPVPFQHLVRLLVLCGRIANVLNGRRGRVRTLVGPGVADGGEDVLSGLQAQLVKFYAELPEEMKWSVEAFKRQEARGHGVGLHFVERRVWLANSSWFGTEKGNLFYTSSVGECGYGIGLSPWTFVESEWDGDAVDADDGSVDKARVGEFEDN